MKKPNKLQTIVSVASCKLTRALLRRTGRGGTAIPGIVALKLSKNVLSVPARGMKIIVVTGTNGKTTTCNMIAHAITSAGYPCLLNKSGANLLHGIASDLLCSTDWQGRPKYPYAVLECDEAALKQVVPLIHPGVIVVTNLFSDQVDRYGGVENTLKEIRTGVELSPKSTLVLNAEDPLSSSLALDTPNKVIRFGLEQSVGVQGNIDLSDAGTCPRCGSAYEYDYHVYAHLGGFRCPKCGLKRRTPDVAVTSIDEKDAAGTTVHMRTVAGSPDSRRIRIALPAVYNIYNAAAAVAASIAVNIPLEDACGSLSTVKSSFGRLETFDLNGIRLQMILVKNPAGCNQAFSYVTGLNEDYTAVLCLNNRTGDGHDISWIASTDYEKLCADPHLKKIYVAGDCAQALSERLKEAGAVSEDEERMEVITDYDEIVSRLKSEGRTAFLLPNYTSMMELRQALSKETGSRDFWE
ncbi:MAG: MurT ligase domain-containing protein [Eubacteriales bacterium]|nr:MurT ligase domain-containing protein [Eubacteriales bacterium]